jgi:hypothetical protein
MNIFNSILLVFSCSVLASSPLIACDGLPDKENSERFLSVRALQLADEDKHLAQRLREVEQEQQRLKDQRGELTAVNNDITINQAQLTMLQAKRRHTAELQRLYDGGKLFLILKALANEMVDDPIDPIHRRNQCVLNEEPCTDLPVRVSSSSELDVVKNFLKAPLLIFIARADQKRQNDQNIPCFTFMTQEDPNALQKKDPNKLSPTPGFLKIRPSQRTIKAFNEAVDRIYERYEAICPEATKDLAKFNKDAAAVISALYQRIDHLAKKESRVAQKQKQVLKNLTRAQDALIVNEHQDEADKKSRSQLRAEAADTLTKLATKLTNTQQEHSILARFVTIIEDAYKLLIQWKVA